MKKLISLVVLAVASVEALRLIGVDVNSTPFWMAYGAIIASMALLLAGPGKNKAKRGDR